MPNFVALMLEGEMSTVEMPLEVEIVVSMVADAPEQ